MQVKDKTNTETAMLSSLEERIFELENNETHKTNDIDDLLVKSNILHGKLSEAVKLAEDSKSDLGKEFSKIEKKEIMEAIKNLENKILKIKLTVDQK